MLMRLEFDVQQPVLPPGTQLVFLGPTVAFGQIGSGAGTLAMHPPPAMYRSSTGIQNGSGNEVGVALGFRINMSISDT